MKKSHITLFSFLGVLFWLMAALIIRVFGEFAFTEGNAYLFLFFGAAIPLSFFFMFVSSKLSGLAYSELLRPMVLMTAIATFLDGIALAWFHQLYGHSFDIALHGAAVILWGAGWGLLLSLFAEKRQPS